MQIPINQPTTPRVALQNLKGLVDLAVKAGLCDNSETVLVFHDSLAVLQNALQASAPPEQGKEAGA